MKICLLIFFFHFFGFCFAQTVENGAIKVIIVDSTMNDRHRLIIISESNNTAIKDTITSSMVHRLTEGYYTVVVKFPRQSKKIKWKNIHISPGRLFFLEVMLVNGRLKRKTKTEKSKWENCG
ncbi:MAG TPA: hypothetical protein VKZ44_00830 [Taishania sp.]|nr:hypothetical protein [Taishania sp.]